MEISLQYVRPQLEYRLRLVLQEAWKFCRRARRTVLTGDDVFNAWRLVCAETPTSLQRSAMPVSDGTIGLIKSKTELRPGSTGFGECFAVV